MVRFGSCKAKTISDLTKFRASMLATKSALWELRDLSLCPAHADQIDGGSATTQLCESVQTLSQTTAPWRSKLIQDVSTYKWKEQWWGCLLILVDWTVAKTRWKMVVVNWRPTRKQLGDLPFFSAMAFCQWHMETIEARRTWEAHDAKNTSWQSCISERHNRVACMRSTTSHRSGRGRFRCGFTWKMPRSWQIKADRPSQRIQPCQPCQSCPYLCHTLPASSPILSGHRAVPSNASETSPLEMRRTNQINNWMETDEVCISLHIYPSVHALTPTLREHRQGGIWLTEWFHLISRAAFEFDVSLEFFWIFVDAEAKDFKFLKVKLDLL